MKKRVIYRYVGQGLLLLPDRTVPPGGFISREVYNGLSEVDRLRQEIRLAA